MPRDYSQLKLYDELRHYKDDQNQECIVFPITRADNVIGNITAARTVTELSLAKLGLLICNEDSVGTEELGTLFGHSIV